MFVTFSVLSCSEATDRAIAFPGDLESRLSARHPCGHLLHPKFLGEPEVWSPNYAIIIVATMSSNDPLGLRPSDLCWAVLDNGRLQGHGSITWLKALSAPQEGLSCLTWAFLGSSDPTPSNEGSSICGES